MAMINFLKPKNKLEEGGRASAPVQQDAGEPEKKCPNCRKDIPLSKLLANDLVCPCGHHFRMRARQRIKMIADKDSFRELFAPVISGDPLDFPGYRDKIETVRLASREDEAVICGTARIEGISCCLFVMEPAFMMGSMGTIVGEKITRLFEYATQKSLPVVLFTASGGARMQEGIFSLMQMAKISAAVKAHSKAGLCYITVLTDPTTGGVTASFAMQGDIILAEPRVLIGFAGRRVIEQTLKQDLPDDFQKAVFLLALGFIDQIVPRNDLRTRLSNLIILHTQKGWLPNE